MASTLRFASFDEVLAALDGVTDPVPTSGPVVAHCAASVTCSVAGYPSLKPAWFRATIGRLVKRRFLRRGTMSHDTGAGLPGEPPISGEMPLGTARAELRAAIARFLAHDGALAPHPVFGDCSKAEYERLHAMHIADHLGALGGA
ncbi:MAG TPA: DUF1569 domain-containing protein [Kofleriaceae bacterium]|nr:DUF1569 domain-containing protein [Kofleriaceae bacterium]